MYTYFGEEAVGIQQPAFPELYVSTCSCHCFLQEELVKITSLNAAQQSSGLFFADAISSTSTHYCFFDTWQV